MTQLTIEINSNKALKLIQDLEDMQLIKVLKGKAKGSKKKLSERLAGSLSANQARELDIELKKIRSEWERGI
jgi:ribosomal protein L18E